MSLSQLGTGITLLMKTAHQLLPKQKHTIKQQNTLPIRRVNIRDVSISMSSMGLEESIIKIDIDVSYVVEENISNAFYQG